MQTEFRLRAMTPEDGPAIAALSDQSSDTGAVGFHNLYHHDAYATLMALHENACGVVAEAPDHPGIVGMGMLSLGECQFEGALRPFAYLFGLQVHPDFRRRGIASQLATWRVQVAREKFGDAGVIFAGIQSGNTGSQRTAARWSNRMINGRTLTVIVQTRGGAAPGSTGQSNGLDVRLAEDEDYEEIARRQNAFYAGYNLYPPRAAESICAWHALAPFGAPVRGYYVAYDERGNLLAGMSVTEEGKLITTEITHMNQMLRVANTLIKLFPSDRRVKRLHIKDFWFAPDHLEAGAYLWESLRRILRKQGNVLMMFIDPQTPLAEVIRLPWYLPRPGGSLVLSVPEPIQVDRPLYFLI